MCFNLAFCAVCGTGCNWEGWVLFGILMGAHLLKDGKLIL